MTETATVTNISCYLFAPLSDLKTLREQTLTLCRAEGLKGTILLSTEGINMFVAGAAEKIEKLLIFLRAVPGLERLTPKYSLSSEQPFRRMLVRIKKEIIAFGVDGIDPARHTSPRLTAKELKQWLDEGRPVTLLDTRNDYEVKLGTFKGALPAGIGHFRHFPEAVRQLPEELKKQPIVTFCTGGIRCEKAAPFMESQGFEQVWQLEGGILKYFEEVGGAHYDGECFVFDQRVGVDPALRETDSTQCFHCQAPLTPEDQEDPRYVEGVSCPYCHKTDEQKRVEEIAKKQEAIRRVTTPLPGCTPQDNHRPISIAARCHGLQLLEALCVLMPGVRREEWQQIFAAGRLLTLTRQPALPEQIVQAGERYLRLLPADVEPEVNADIVLLHQDEAVLVLHKPAPLPMHPGGRYLRNTLQHFLLSAWHPEKPRPAHRLDANTSGLVVAARTHHYAGILQPQFARGEVEKVYLARIHGSPEWENHTCEASISEEPGELGSRTTCTEGGLPARTEFRVMRRLGDGTTLLEARPLTGRTNQIRIHLWQLGHSICGDPAYLPGRELGGIQTLPVGAPPMCLHAWKLSFTHPQTRQRVHFEAPPPAWCAESL